MHTVESPAAQLKHAVRQTKGNKRQVAEILNAAGLKEHGSMLVELNARFAELSGCTKYSFCTAEALNWADLGTREEPGYYRILTAFFEHKVKDSEIDWALFANRYGAKSLHDAASGYLALSHSVPEAVKNGTARAQELIAFQELAISKAMDLAKKNQLHGFGSWLFCGPQKVLAIMTPKLWTDANLQSLRMPLGAHVMAAFRELSNVGVAGIDPDILKDSDGGLSGSAFGTLFLAHSFQQELAASAQGTYVLHINTGLHILGGGGNCAFT